MGSFLSSVRRTLSPVALLVAVIALAGCASSNIEPTFVKEAKTLGVPDTTALLNVSDLRIGPLDKLKITVFGVPQLSGDFQLDHLGRLRMPLIGEVDVKGFTPSELADFLQTKFDERYLNKAEINVQVLESAGGQITIEGTVKNTGMMPVRGNLTLMQAVALSGGLAEGANPRRVLIFRTIEQQRRVAVFDLTAIRRGQAEDPRVFGNDVVVVDGSATNSTYRELLRSIPLLTLFRPF